MIKGLLIIFILLSCITMAAGDDLLDNALNIDQSTKVLSEPELEGGLLIPEHLKGSKYVVNGSDSPETISAPYVFDWRYRGTTPVKDQGDCGSCYAFSTVGMVESHIKLDTEKSYDLSEEHPKNCMWQTKHTLYGGCVGGTVPWVINEFTHNGIVLESDFPYVPRYQSCKPVTPTFRVTDWHMISLDLIPSKGLLKEYIKGFGPIASSVIVNDWPSNYNGSYVLSPDKEGKNHGVVIVGWNDSRYDRNVSGHWIVKNSWGKEWGDNGYALLEYDKANIGTHASVVAGYEGYDPDVQTMYYDEAGWTDSIGSPGRNTRAVCVYSVGTAEVERIEFWTTGRTSNVSLYLFDSFNKFAINSSILGNELYSIEGLEYRNPGYHSVKLKDSVSTPTGTMVVMAIIENMDSVYPDGRLLPIAMDHESNTAPGRSFIDVGDDAGWYNIWFDMNNVSLSSGPYNADVALRLRVSGDISDVPQCNHILLRTAWDITDISVGENLTFSATCYDQHDNEVDCCETEWLVSNDTVGRMNGTKFEAEQYGTVDITAQVPCCKNSLSNTVTLNVIPGKYLTEDEFKERMINVTEQLELLDVEDSGEFQDIIKMLNDTDMGDVVYIIPDDIVSVEVFDQMMNDLQDKIDEISERNRSWYQKIKDFITKLLD